MPKENSTSETIKKDLRVIAQASERLAKVARAELKKEIHSIGDSAKKHSKAGILKARKLLMHLDQSMSKLSDAIGACEIEVDSTMSQKPPKKQRIKVQ